MKEGRRDRRGRRKIMGMAGVRYEGGEDRAMKAYST